MKKVSLIILTRNEIEGVKATLRKIPFELVDEYFAVDYNSTDGTVEFFKKNKIPVVKQKIPGRGEAFKLAARQAKGKYLLFFSPDGNENPADIAKLIDCVNHGADLAIASRFMKESRNEEDDQVLKLRKWANQAFTFVINLFWGGKLTDSINGYRIIKKELFEKIKPDASGFAIEYQMSIRALKLGAKIMEFPTVEGNRIGGESTSYAIPTGITFCKLLLTEVLNGTSFLQR